MSDTERDLIYAPWNDETVRRLNAYQTAGFFHPFTCGNRVVVPHPDDAVLIAEREGWRCEHCDYRQHWAHRFMARATPEIEGQRVLSFKTVTDSALLLIAMNDTAQAHIAAELLLWRRIGRTLGIGVPGVGLRSSNLAAMARAMHAFETAQAAGVKWHDEGNTNGP